MESTETQMQVGWWTFVGVGGHLLEDDRRCGK